MQRYMERIGCSAATVAIEGDGELLVARGYGWVDKEKRRKTPPDALIGIASCDKPLLAASIRRLASVGRVDLNSTIFNALRIKPAGKIVDERIRHITIAELLEHKSGWGGDIRGELEAKAKRMGLPDPSSVPTLLSVVMTQPLKHDPGTVSDYSNFGFDTLRHLIAAATGRNSGAFFRTELLINETSLEVQETAEPVARGKVLVWNAFEGGPTSASAPYLCKFMRRYWITGELRDNGRPLWVMNGSLPGSTSLMVWRADGINLVALFNGRNQTRHDEIYRDLEAVLDRFMRE